MTTEMKAKHTPGPWYVHHIGQEIYVKPTTGGFVCDMQAADLPPDERLIVEANARLIAVTPDLLKAAMHFFEWHANRFEEFSDEVNMELLFLVNELEAAFTKAEPGSTA